MTDKEKTIKELKDALDSLDVTNKYRLNLIRAIEYIQEEPISEGLEEASKQLCDVPNLYVDCSSSLSYIPLETSKEIIRRYGADKVLFGTDYPLHDPINEMGYLEALQLEDSEYQAIFSENAKKIFKID